MIFRKIFAFFCCTTAVTLEVVHAENDRNESVVGSTNNYTNRIPFDEELIFLLNKVALPLVRQNEGTLKTFCRERGGMASPATAEHALTRLRSCIAGSTLYAEFQTGRQRQSGSDDSRNTQKYCEYAEQAKNCVHRFLGDIEVCLSERQRSMSKQRVHNTWTSVHGFVCANDGDLLAAFISEGGQDCIRDRRAGLQKCVELSANGKTLDELLNFIVAAADSSGDTSTFVRRQCKLWYRTRLCLVAELLTCPSQVPANVIESVINLFLCSNGCASYTAIPNLRCGNRSGQCLRSSTFVSIFLICAYFILNSQLRFDE